MTFDSFAHAPKRIIGFDAGPERTGFAELIFDGKSDIPIVGAAGHEPNRDLQEWVKARTVGFAKEFAATGVPTFAAFEMIVNYGTIVGASIHNTSIRIGMLARDFQRVDIPVYLIPNSMWRLVICARGQAKTPELRQRLYDLFPGGTGTPNKPGPLIKARGNEHVLDAIGIGMALHKAKDERCIDVEEIRHYG